MLNDSGVLIHPAAGWVRGFMPSDDEPEEMFTRVQQWRLQRRQQLLAFQEVLGLMIGNTILLPHPSAPTLGPAVGRDGGLLRWSIWAPHRHVLIDIFRRKLPAPSELEDRAAFAQGHGLRYGIVEPGRRLSLVALTEWLTSSGKED